MLNEVLINFLGNCMGTEFENRKQQHLHWALDSRVQAAELSALDAVTLNHEALPELNFEQVSIETPFQNKGLKKYKLKTPFFISAMTAGHAQAFELNRRFAKACAKRGWIFGVGSQRRELMDQSVSMDRWSMIRRDAADLVAIGNLGLSQLIQSKTEQVSTLVENLDAQAFAIHLNALQEVIQPEGTPQFAGGLKAIRKLCKELKVPVILKETGCGFSAATLHKIKVLPLLAVDVSGLGGTHWGRIEGKRAEAKGDQLRSQAAVTFSDWGVNVVDSTRLARKILNPKTEVWASGGVRNGLDAAKLISCGATRVGFAKPALEAALKSDQDLLNWMEQIEFEFKTALFCTGSASAKQLYQKSKPRASQ